MARALADAGVNAVFSYAGRTETPMAQPLPTRMGGFGGADGLARYLQAESITHVIDATHPFAAQMSTSAVAACAATNVALATLERPPWQAGGGDRWSCVPDMLAALAALPDTPTRIFLAIGRLNLDLFAAKPQHHYLLRVVDPPKGALPLPNADVIVAKGPFSVDADHSLMVQHATQLIVAKNGGGDGARAKLEAARALGLPVIMVDRPAVRARRTFATVGAVMAWLGHDADLGV